ncbi:septum formation family protein [Actinotalea sp. K2]|uniref:septum formation family protein n=1 Tax=Actinotalea sp. K2 TaxID=2939438 RepID=UPI00201777E4|nr:septum formation family protein [Actinotalea sp. K2]MCL3861868.1 septum formation family protein [Actinotalea sp. K2]
MHSESRIDHPPRSHALRGTATSSAPIAVLRLTAAAIGAAGLLTGCSLFGDATVETVSVLDVEVGDCVLAPEEITSEVADLRRVACSEPHEQEVFALVPYTQPDGSRPDSYPGDAVLVAFADGACIEKFREYTGVDYRDSDLFFTYLLPSARGWEQGGDHDVTCFITTTGAQTSTSARGTSL